MRSWLNTIVVGVVILMAAFLATPTLAVEPIQVTRGSVFPFAAGLETGYDISGQARMVRSATGHTTVTVRVQGLTPNTSYGVNVHNQACSNEAGGGHYQHEVGGAVDNINEILGVMTTRSNGYGYNRIVNDFVARSEARSVIIHTADNTSLACADLSPITVSSYTFGTTQIEELASLSIAIAANPELMIHHRFVVSDDRSATGQPVFVDIEVVRNNYYNALRVAQTDPAVEPVDIEFLRRNNPNYYHPGR